MAQYTVSITATSNTTINTDDCFIELNAPASTVFKVKRVRVGFSDGTATAGVDNHYRIKLMRWDTASAGSPSTPTINKRNPTAPAAVTVAKSKNGTTALALGTTNVETLDIISPNGRAMFEWLARDDDDMISVKADSLFGIVISSGVVSQLFTVSVDWVE